MSVTSNSILESELNYSDQLLDESIYPPGSDEYRQARKRRQNRESASRIRAQKKQAIAEIQEKISSLSDFNSNLQIELLKLKLENEKLRTEYSLTEKGSLIFSKFLIFFCIFLVLCLHIHNSSSSDSYISQVWLYVLAFCIPLIIILIK